MSVRVLRALSLVLAVAACASARAAEVEHGEMTVGAFISPPFMMRRADGEFHGMAADIWERAAKEAGIRARYVEYHNLDRMLQDLREGRLDFVATKFVVTHERTGYLKYSFPWHDGGLRIMTRVHREGLWSQLRRNGMIRTYAWLLLILAVLTVATTFARRRLDPDFTREWKDGLAQNLHGLVVAAKSGKMDNLVKNWTGYLLSAFWMLFGVAFVAYITSTIASTMTASAFINREIAGVQDLPGKRVGVTRGGISESHLREIGISPLLFESPDDVEAALIRGRIDAMVADSPSLEYFLHTHPGLELTLAGPVFKPLRNAFAGAHRHADAMDRLSVAIIGMHDDGSIEKLREKYFGRVK